MKEGKNCQEEDNNSSDEDEEQTRQRVHHPTPRQGLTLNCHDNNNRPTRRQLQDANTRLDRG